MARPRNPEIQEHKLQGFKHFKLLVPMLEGLHDCACECDTIGGGDVDVDGDVNLADVAAFVAVLDAGGLLAVMQGHTITQREVVGTYQR